MELCDLVISCDVSFLNVYIIEIVCVVHIYIPMTDKLTCSSTKRKQTLTKVYQSSVTNAHIHPHPL